MKIAITGVTGLIGKSLYSYLDSIDFDVIGLSRNNPDYAISDYSYTDLCQKFKNVDVVVHLAAKRGGGINGSLSDYYDNIELTEKVCTAVEAAGVKQLIFLSSISIYGDYHGIPWTERDIPSPSSNYGISKMVGEYICRRLHSKNVTVTILRCSHVFGYEDSKYMTNIFIREALSKSELTVVGKSVSKREFIYVKDVVKGIVWAFSNSMDGIFNLGTGETLTNLEVATKINDAFNNPTPIRYESNQDEGILPSCLDNTLINSLGFFPDFDFQKACLDIFHEMEKEFDL